MIEKNQEEIKVGFKMKRKKDNTLCELKDISKDKSDKEYFHFFGFTIKDRKNLKKHFQNNYGNLYVYE